MNPSADPRQAPFDPRDAWDLGAVGELPTLCDLDEMVTRVIAPNPSPMTLDGTNTYVIAAPGASDAIIVDPGPSDAVHLERARRALAVRGAQATGIVVTHHHLDHSEAAAAWGQALGCPLLAARREVAGPDGHVLVDGQVIDRGALAIEVIATPGHTADHLSLRLETGAILTGDHILGRGTSVVAHPDGDLTAYLGSLRRVLGLGPDALYPGHGPQLTDDPAAVIDYYLQHRAYRRQQVIDALRDGPLEPRQIVARLYATVDRGLWAAAEDSTRATLEALQAQGLVTFGPDGRARLIA